MMDNRQQDSYLSLQHPEAASCMRLSCSIHRVHVCTCMYLFWRQGLHKVEGTVSDVGAPSVQPLHGNMGGVKQLSADLN